MRGHAPGRVLLAALVVRRKGDRPGSLSTEYRPATAEPLAELCGRVAYRYRFALPARPDASYELDGTRYQVNGACGGDLRVAYVSCDGMERGDLDRPPEERNMMWRRLADRHGESPFNLLLHGGDQIYADEVLHAHPATREWPRAVPTDLSASSAAELRSALRTWYFRRYVTEFTQPEFAWLAARVPSLSMWDDHDICNGWGSLPEWTLDSEVGRQIFEAAREFFLLFQLCAGPARLPEICLDRTGESLTWRVDLPGLYIVAPDLRSERRPGQVIGDQGWPALRSALSGPRAGKMLLLSSVPALGPRLSLLERFMDLTPWLEKYESDLKDQWQSRTHRDEWRRLLRELIAVHDRGVSVTVLSGEIHLATRATMETATGEIHQLIASGIAHPPPPRPYARIMGALARLGEGPLEGHRIMLHPLPGQRHIYSAERNFLVLSRMDNVWSASWDLEESGRTPLLSIGRGQLRSAGSEQIRLGQAAADSRLQGMPGQPSGART